MPSNSNRIGILFNPISGSGSGERLAKQSADFLAARGFVVTLRHTEKDYRSRTLNELIGSPDLLVICGGDGTLLHLLPLLVSSNVPVYMLPSGNESLFARGFSATKDLEVLAAAISAWRVSEHQVPHVNGKPFFTMASVGLDSSVVEILSRKRMGKINNLGYVVPTLQAFVSHKAPKISLTVDGKEVLRAESGYFIVANTPQYAGGLNFVPEASSCSGLLSSRFFPYASRMAYLPWVFNFLSRSSVNLRGSNFFQGREFHLTHEGEAEYPVQADGEYIGRTPLVVGLGEGKLRVLEVPDRKLL